MWRSTSRQQWITPYQYKSRDILKINDPKQPTIKTPIFTGHTDLIVYNLANIIMLLQASCCGPLTEQSCSCLRIWSCWSAAFSSTSPLAEVREKKHLLPGRSWVTVRKAESEEEEKGRGSQWGGGQSEERDLPIWCFQLPSPAVCISFLCCYPLLLP